jgi:predicted permease
MSGDNSAWSIMVDGLMPHSISEAPSAKPEQVTPDYFRAMSIPMVRGRAFAETDRPGGSPVVVVNETMARELWPDRDPIGHTIKMFSDSAPWVTVVGVAKDVRSNGGDQDVPPTMYFPYAQAGTSAYYTPLEMTLVVKTASDPLALAPDFRRAVHDLDPVAPISSLQSMDAVVGSSLANRRFATTLLAAFAMLALLLAGIGIYGVIAFGVSERTFEMGLRQALGAERHSLLILVVTEGVRMTLIGLAMGLLGALAAGRLIRSLLVGTSPSDAPTLVLVSVMLILVAILASVVPAWRAMSVHPTEALRSG